MKKILVILCLFAALKSNALTAVFTGTVQSGCLPLVVDFTDASIGMPISWAYDFGDGGSSSAQNPRYTFTKAGKYTVKMTVYDGSVYSSATVTIVVWKLPATDFKVTQYAYCPGETINFLNATTPGDTTISSSSWDFGDGSVVNSTGNVKKTYNNAGSYNIKLTVRDHHNCVSTVVKNNFITVHSKPTAVFTYNSKYSCVAPQRINFINNSSNSVSYAWDLGDGTTSTQANPIVFYNDAKNYSIKMTATSDKGCTATQTQTLVVQFGKIKANYTADAFNGCIPYNPQFKNQSQPLGVKLDYAWDFGDGTKSTAENPFKNYTKTGTYQVKLRVSGSGVGCSDSIIKTMLISDKPKATVYQRDTLACQGELNSLFRASTSSDIDKFTWFIDGKNIDTKIDSLNYKFEKSGIYNVVVLLLDKAGCQQTYAFKKVVVQHLYGGFWSPNLGGCIPYSHDIIDTTKSDLSSNYAYTWDDGDGNIFTNRIPNLTYKDTGRYELRQKVIDQYGCVDEAWTYVWAGIKIKPSFVLDKHIICNNEDIKMTNTTPDSLRDLVHQWIWEFGNNKGNDEESFVTNIRDYPRKTTPLLIAVNNYCRDSCVKEDSVTIKAPLADFIFSFDTCFSNTAKLRNSSVLTTDYTWYLPDGKTSKDSVFYFKFTPNKKEIFSLSVVNKLTGCKDSLSQEITSPKTTSNIVATKKSGCTPQIFKFENFQTRAYRSHWDMGNGDTSAIQDSFRYTYHVPGTYIIKHTGWDIRSCPYTSQTKITVDGPTAGGKIWPERGCLPLSIQLVDSVSNGKVKRKYWKFEDDPQWRKATNKNETLNYTIYNMPLSGDTFFRIELFVEDSNGCQTSRVFKVRPSGPKAGIQISPESRCDAVEYTFNASLDSASAFYP
ncbi:MAG: PKD domain-containing protein, partial [Bacteroidia bacterium]|nr:PKD domain-containing protein [Bacteroidia bacterium]